MLLPMPLPKLAELKMFLDIASVRVQCALDQLAIGQQPSVDSAVEALREAILAIEAAQASSFDITHAQMCELWELTLEIQRNLCVLLLVHGVVPSLQPQQPPREVNRARSTLTAWGRLEN